MNELNKIRKNLLKKISEKEHQDIDVGSDEDSDGDLDDDKTFEIKIK